MTRTWNPDSPSLLLALVCFADILGFRAMTKRAIESGSERNFLWRIKRSLAAAYEKVREARTPYGEEVGIFDTVGEPHTLDEKVPGIFDMKIFTDNIVVAYPLLDQRLYDYDAEPELGTLLMLFAEVQAGLAADGFLLRGAIAFGNHYQDNDIAFGEALLEAVDLDKQGGPPRLVIASSAEKLISEQLKSYGDSSEAPHYDHLLEDPRDDRLFVNYLHAAFQYFHEVEIDEEGIDFRLLAAHRENVHRGLRRYKFDSRIRVKYEWLATYHNYVCRTFAEQFAIRDYEGADPKSMAISEDAQRALAYLVNFETLPTMQPPRSLDAQRLRQRLTAS